MATTTNYSWTTPDDTALVKDGAAAIRSLGTAIDSTVFTNAGAAIAKTIVDAKGDIIAATAADTVSRLAVGANDTVLTADSSAATGLKWAAPTGLQVFSINETQANNTQGGTFTLGAWRTRVLNTSVQNTISGASLASDQFTLPAGTYSLTAFAPCWKVGSNNARIYNITDSAVVAIGNNQLSGTANTSSTTATVAITFTIAATKTFELQHYASATLATNGFGAANGNGYDEIYSSVTIVKVA